MASNQHSGYPMIWFKDQDFARNYYECAICLEVFKDPMQVRDWLSILFLVYRRYFEEHINECNSTSSNRDGIEFKVEVLRQQFERRLNLEISTLKQEHAKGINEMSCKHENDIQQLKRKHESDIQHLQNKHNEDVMRLEKDIKKLRSTTFTMRIPKFISKLSKAKTSCDLGYVGSDPFFSASFGYKIKLSVHLNEIQDGTESYMGAYICLMRSDHDGILNWPFKKSYTFTLVDQQDHEAQRKNHSMTVVPQGEANYKRPRQEQNTGIGFPRFISHTKIHTRKYIKDSVVYLKLDIEG